jgi:hypothetical protein
MGKIPQCLKLLKNFQKTKRLEVKNSLFLIHSGTPHIVYLREPSDSLLAIE